LSREDLCQKNLNSLFTSDFEKWYERVLRNFQSHKNTVGYSSLIDNSGKKTAVRIQVNIHESEGDLFSTCLIRKLSSECITTLLPGKTVSVQPQPSQMTVLSTLISGIAHEINNPNNLISLSTDLLKEIWSEVIEFIGSQGIPEDKLLIHGNDLDSLNQNIRNLLDNILYSSDRINRTISAIRDFVRIDSSENMTECSIPSIVKSSLLLCDDLIKKHTDEFIVHYASDIPRTKAYLRMLQQTIVNIVKNACEALTDRTQKITLSVVYQKETNSISINISDEGHGIAPENMDQIYNPFFTTRRSNGHLGLGLSITQAIIHKHNGSISISSEHGYGTSVTLKLPAGSHCSQKSDT